MKIRTDTREQKPFIFKEFTCETVVDTVPIFDYCLDEDLFFAVERKSLPDLVNSISSPKGFLRELKKIAKARAINMPRIYYVVEGSFNDFVNYQLSSTRRINRGFLLKRWRLLAYYHGVDFIWADDAGGGALATYLILKTRHEQLTGKRDMPLDHAKISPSSLHYREQCPSYTPSIATSEAAEEGTRLHHAAETGDYEGLNEEQVTQVDLCLQYCDQLALPDSVVLAEQKVTVEDITWGTADQVVISGKHMHIIDFKFGHYPVAPAESNRQGWAYALGALNLPQAAAVTDVSVHFLLPRQDTIDIATFSRKDDYNRMFKRIAGIVQKAEDALGDPEGAHRTAGDHCRFCSIKASCKEFMGEALQLPVRAGLNLPEKIGPTDLSRPEDVAKVLRVLPLIEDWMKCVRAAALEKLKEGDDIPGYRLNTRVASRVISDVLQAWEVAESFDVPLDEFLPTCKIAIGHLDEVIRNHAKRGDKKKAVERAHQELTARGVEASDGEITYMQKERH